MEQKESSSKLIIDNILDLIVKINPEDLLEYVTPSAENLLGYRPEEFQGRSIYDPIHPEDRERVRSAIDDAKRTRKPQKAECRIRHADGHYIWFEGTGQVISDEEGTPAGAIISIRDISDGKTVEEALRESERENAIIAEMSRIISSDLNIEEVYERFSEEAKKLISFDRIAINIVNYEEGMITIAYSAGAKVKGRDPGDSFPLANSINEELIQTQSGLLVQLEKKEKLSALFPTLVSTCQAGIKSMLSVPLFSKGKVFGALHLRSFKSNAYVEKDVKLAERIAAQIAGAIANAQLFLQCRRMEEGLKKSEERYRSVVEGQTELICRWKPDGTLTFVNEAYCRYFGKKREELVGRSFMPLIPAEDYDYVSKQISSISLANPMIACEYRVVSFNGEVRWQQWTDQGIFDLAGNLGELQSVGRDITERRLAETKLRESEEKLRRLSAQLLTGQEDERRKIAADVHDSLNPLLAAAKMRLDLAIKKAGQGEDAQTAALAQTASLLEKCIEESRRIQNNLRPHILDNLGILAAIRWFLGELNTTYPGIDIRQQMDIREEEISDSWKTAIFRILQEAFFNIARHSGASLAEVSLQKMQDRIELRIRDNGAGFDPAETLSRVSPGLGLSSMKERTALLGGSFEIESASGQGTILRASWPLDNPTGKAPL